MYKIVRFHMNKPCRVVCMGLSLEEAKAWCSRSDTHKLDERGCVLWFDGFTKE